MKLIKGVLLLHIIPFALALLTVIIIFSTGLPYKIYRSQKKEEVLYSYNDLPKQRSHVDNYSDSVWSELVLAQSLIEKSHLTVFGSSELSSSPSVCNRFFENEFDLKVTSVGHAFNELFSIYCQLLRMYPYLDNAEISIILSPVWFEDGKGTNPQAFVEFVPPNFISHILRNKAIADFHKQYVSKVYYDEYEFEISGNRLEYEFLSTYYIFPFLRNYSQILPREYLLQTSEDVISNTHSSVDWELYLKEYKEKSISTLNSFYIDSTYSKDYLTNSKGEKKRGIIRNIVVTDNDEIHDLKMVMKLLKEKNCNVSFVMQPLNPYYYENIDVYAPIMDSIDILMNRFGYQDNYCNMFSLDKESYEPGVLKDVMHFSDYGWIKVNKFLYEQHFEN